MSSATYQGDVIAAGARRRSRLKPALFIAGGLAVLVGIGIYGRQWWTTGRFVETTDDAYVGGNVTPIAPHVAGFIQRILVADNAPVHAGEVLVQIDPRDAEAALAHARAVLTARDAAADSLRAQLALQQAAIRQSEADVVAKGAQAAFADQDARRYADLAVTAAGSRQDAQRSSSLDREARAAVSFAVAGLQAAREKLKVLQAQIAEADAAVSQARADLQTARLDLDYTEIRAPIDGTVGNRAAQVGGYVKAGTYLISITPAKGLWVDQLTHMTPGQVAEVTADVLPGHVFRGRVASFTPGTGAVFSIIPPENATGNFTKIVQRVPVRVVLDASDGSLTVLRPGLSTTVSVNVKDAAK